MTLFHRLAAVASVNLQPSAFSLRIFVAPPRIFKTGEEWILNLVRSCKCRRLSRPQLRPSEIFRQRPARGRFLAERRQPHFGGLFQKPIRPRTRDGELRSECSSNSKRCCAPRRRNGSRSRSTSTCRCFTWSIACSARFFRTAKITTTAAGRATSMTCRLRDRVGAEHPLKADAGCRNTVFNSQAQTGAEFVERMLALGVRNFRVEFLNETPERGRADDCQIPPAFARRNFRHATLARIEIVQPARCHARTDGQVSRLTRENIPAPAATNNPSPVPPMRAR